MRKTLRDSREFQDVYRNGKRYDGALITVFVKANKSSQHRLGITASRKALGKSVDRNRAKRLLREAFRSSEELLSDLTKSYDWVLNAKRKILSEKMAGPASEFQQVIEQVRKGEAPSDQVSILE